MGNGKEKTNNEINKNIERKTGNKAGNVAGKLSTGFKFAWSTQASSLAVLMVLVNSYVSLYATNFMMIPVGTVGIIFMVSKIFDGFTDIVAGYLIDRTNTKLGKGRPYSLALIGYWGCTVALFCAPELDVNGSILYLFLMYSLINAIFNTLITCSDPVYMANAVTDTSQIVSLSSFQGIITMIFSLLSSIIIPQMAATLGTTREGWRIIAIVLAVPMTFFGLLRFACVKEIKKNQTVGDQKLSVKQQLNLLFHNKYIILFALIMLIANIGSNFGTNVNTYYYLYIVGDIGAGSVGAVSVISLILSIALTPVLSKKFGFVRVIRATVLIGMVGYLLRLFNVQSILLLAFSCFVSSIGFATTYMFINVFIADCMDYGEWKNGLRSEGVISCAQSVTCKVGTAFGLGISGVMLGLAGFNGELAVQNEPANMMIIFCTTIAPAILCLIMYFMLRAYDLDKLMPKIKEELKRKRGEE